MKASLYNTRVVIHQMSSDEQAVVERECKIVYKRFNGTRVVTEKVYNFYDPQEKSFPRGLLFHIADKLEEIGEDIELDEYTTPKTHSCKMYPKNTVELWDNQVKLSEAIDADEDGMGFISSATGTGKTQMMKLLVYKKQVRTLILVPTTPIRDAIAEAIGNDIGKSKVSTTLPKEDGRTLSSFRKNRVRLVVSDDFDEEIYDTPEKKILFNKGYRLINGRMRKVEKPNKQLIGKTENKKYSDVYVICHGSLRNMSEDVLNSFEMVIVDEADRMSDDELVFLDNARNCYFRYFFSATMWRNRKEDMRRLMAYVSTKVIFEELPSESIAKKRIASVVYEQMHSPKPTHQIDDITYDRKGNMIIVKEKDPNVIFDLGIITNESRNNMICELAYEQYTLGRRVLISAWEANHCIALAEKIKEKNPDAKVLCYYSKQDGKIKEEVIDLTKHTEESLIVVGTIAIGIGVDTKVIDTVILADCRKDSNRFIQVNGRGVRQDGTMEKVLYVFDFYDWFNEILKKHSRERKKVFTEYYKADYSYTEKKFGKVKAKLKRD